MNHPSRLSCSVDTASARGFLWRAAGIDEEVDAIAADGNPHRIIRSACQDLEYVRWHLRHRPWAAMNVTRPGR